MTDLLEVITALSVTKARLDLLCIQQQNLLLSVDGVDLAYKPVDTQKTYFVLTFITVKFLTRQTFPSQILEHMTHMIVSIHLFHCSDNALYCLNKTLFRNEVPITQHLHPSL